jgi:hypothetical protein
MEPTIASRVSRITPQEWRVIALAIEGVAPSAACEALGIALGTLESHKQAIRRKLAIPKGERFESFVRSHFAEGVPIPERRDAAAAPAKESSHADRRVRWLLRITLQEVSEAATSARLRAQLLEQTVSRMGTNDVDEAKREVLELTEIAEDLGKLYEGALARIRARGADASQLGS